MADELAPVVQQIVQDAADDAEQAVREEHAVETAAERVEDAAERVEAAAASAHAATVSPALTREDLHSVIAEHVGPLHDRISALENPAPVPEEIAQQAAEETVAEIVEQVEANAEAAEEGIEGGTLGDGEEVVGETVAPETVAEVVGADVPPRKSHFMHRPLFGG